MFIDYVEIEVSAGNGGHGCIAFHTEKFIPKGGPDGGDGGHGGNVVAVADAQLTTLLDFRYRRKYKAENGQPGSGGLKTGKSGKNTVLRLPVGTLIKDLETGEVLYDLDRAEAEFIIARGGRGGHGNAYYKSPTNQAPRKAQDGFPGESRRVSLELKLLADVGLVGQPNAGKSTILSSFSAARPKIADYPFTTLTPNLGIVKLRDYKSFVMADIPGLIEGASEGKGLGHQFLRHIQRTALIVYVIDVNEPDIAGAKEILESELAGFDAALAERPSLVVITKVDTVGESDLKAVSKKLPGDYIYLSAVTRQGANDFLEAIESKLDQQRA
ncbi:MAG: GTPase ObgE [Candidatus Zixiibacteriota bacterium]|nr:MAG: GTPase ObgE [candidate division Zixibacteria bacterium]